mmetsp:Transcript_40879/g.84029  ORF Transcript_40879/g.84029 Transcript_40879/m.84029 type:complete len:286 (-) Transcript_40879:57-914(-)
MFAVVAEVLCHGAARVGREELQRCGIRSSCSHDRGVLQAIVLSQDLEELSHGGSLLSYCDVDAVQVGRLVSRGVDGLLIEDCVDGDCGLASLAIADDQLSLATANWDQAVDSLQASGHGLVHALPGNDARSLELHSATALRLDRPGAIDRRAKGIHNAAQQFLADGDIHNGSGALDAVTFDNGSVIAENHNSDVVGFQVQRHALKAARELHHFACLHALEAVNARNPISHRENATNFLHISLILEVGNALAKDLGELCGAHFGSIPWSRGMQRPRRRVQRRGQSW